MPSWTRILCAIDFSESAHQAMEDAADLARRFGAALTLVHVWEAPRALAARAVVAWPLPASGDAAEIAEALEKWKQEAVRITGAPVETTLAHGPPGAAIVRVADEGRFDLVVVGAQRHGVARVLLGSIAEHVARHAPCPVLVARPPPEWGD